ncbi:hypothetical protein DSECCO2_02950 [anaerobic digester metagenome]
MSAVHVSFIFAILLLSTILQGSVLADTPLYSTDFTDSTGWETNSPSSFYLDNQTGRYHYQITGGTGSYAYYPLAEAFTGPFTLEFDVYPEKTEEKSSFRFGFGTEGYDSQKGPLVLAELYNQNGEQAFSLTGISKENLLSQTFSIPGKANYSGKTVKFSDKEEYHFRITWYPVEKRISLTVTSPGESTPIFSHFVMITGKMEEFSHLFLTSIGEGQNGVKAEGFIDNISLVSLSSVMATPEPTNTPDEAVPTPTLVTSVTSGAVPPNETTEMTNGQEITPVAESIEPLPDRTPLPAPPTPVPTEQAGVLPLAGLFGLCIACLFWRR